MKSETSKTTITSDWIIDQVNEGCFIKAGNLLDLKITSVPMLLDGMFPQYGLAGLFGSSDTGKSAFLRQFAIAVSNGDSDFLGIKLNTRHKKVLYLSTEDDPFATSALLSKHPNSDPSYHENLEFYFDPQDDLIEYLDAALSNHPRDLIIIDAYSDVINGDLNNANNVRGQLHPFKILSSKHRCLFIFLHHSGKGKQKLPPSKDNALGSQAWESKIRSIIEFRLDNNNEKLRHLCLVKGNYTRGANKSHSFVLNFNEDMTFDNTGERQAFDSLGLESLAPSKRTPDIKKRVEEMRLKGKSIRGIVAQMSTDGSPIGKTTVERIVKDLSTSNLEALAKASNEALPEKIEVDNANGDNQTYLGKWMNM